MKEVLIIGGGVVGLWCAWHLHKAGHEVTIADRGDFRDGCSYGNAGMIVPSHFTPLASPGMISKGIRWMFRKSSPFYIRPRLNLELAQWLWQFYRSAHARHVADSASLLRDMHEESREMYRELSLHAGFDFQFTQKGIFMMYRTAAAERDELEAADAAQALGIEAVPFSLTQMAVVEPHLKLDVLGAVHYPGDAHLTPGLLMTQMKSWLSGEGVVFLKNQEVLDIHDHGHSGAEVFLLDGQKIMAENIVVAAGSWSGQLMKKTGRRLPMMDGKGYSMTVRHPDIRPAVPAILHEARVAVTPMGDDLRISGTLEISGMDEKIRPRKVKSILDAMSTYYPGFRSTDPGPVWLGYRPCTPDGLPYIGRLLNASSVIMATGHGMMGMSLAPVTGRIVRDILKGKRGAHIKLHPGRFSG